MVIISIKWGIFLFRYLSKQCRPDWIPQYAFSSTAQSQLSIISGAMILGWWHQFVLKLNSWIYYTYLYCLIWFFMSKTTFFSVMSGRVSLGWTSTKQVLICLAQGNNTVTPVMLELATAWIGLGSNTLLLSHCAPILNYVFFSISWNCIKATEWET